LVGTNPLPDLVAAQILAPKWVHLLYSEDTEREGIPITIEYASWLAQAIDGQEPTPDVNARMYGVNDVYAHKIHGQIESIIKELMSQGLLRGGETIGLNYTGATKPMSVHSYRTIETHMRNRGFKVIYSYLDPRRLSFIFDGDQRPYPIKPQECHIDLQTMVRLHGYKILPGSGRDEPNLRMMPIAKAIGEVCRTEEGFNAWRTWLKSDLQLLPQNDLLQPVLDAFKALCKQTGNSLTPAGIAAAMGEFEKLTSYTNWFLGTWLEELALDAMLELQEVLPIRSPMAGIKPVPIQEGNERNFELDVAAVVGHQLFVISCIASRKAKGETKKHLMEAYVRAQQLGGEEARIALLCCADNKDDIARALKQTWHIDKHVTVFGNSDLSDLKGGLRTWIRENSNVK
jgi:hypothetical protein